MSRKRTSAFEDFISIISRLPWWVCSILAIASYFVLHMMASRPAMSVKSANQLGDAVTHGMLTTLAIFGQYILPFAFGIGALLSGVDSIRQKKLYESIESRSDVTAFNEITWKDFERLVGEYYRRQGFQVTRDGGNGSDGGIDLVLRRNKEVYLVQCKHWKAFKVGVQPLREFYGVIAANGAFGGYFVTSGVYTEDAQEFARGLNIELIDGHKLRKIIDAARQQPEILATSMVTQRIITAPACPKCGAEMKKRVARRGKHSGKEFWGCANFPKCTGTRSSEDAIA